MRDADATNRTGTLGYYVASHARGRGIATAAVAALVRVVRSELGVQELVAEIETGNAESQRVVEHNGFELRGQVLVDDVVMNRYTRAT